jgi:serine phosphatase RsbU (regulator of sigma subunit)
MQDALLPSKTAMDNNLIDYFVFFRPKDIVSGDFLWTNNSEGKALFTVIDCTGHGVPGAFLSIVAHGSLQRSLHVFKLVKVGEILDKVNETFEAMFMLNQHDFDVKDGMEMALCSLDRDKMELEYAAAMHSVYIVRNGNVIEHKGDKQPIGHFENKKNFNTQIVEIQKGDVVYLLSDGYGDQFGGPKGKKFKMHQLQQLIASISPLPMAEQKAELERVFDAWKGTLEQVDDVSILGVRV